MPTPAALDGTALRRPPVALDRRAGVAAALSLLLVALHSVVALAMTTAGPQFSIRAPEGDEQGAVLRDGQLFAGPFQDPRALLVLDAETVLVTDGALGFVVGVGAGFGEPDQNGLAAKQVIVDGLAEPHELTVSDGRILVTTRGDGGVVELFINDGQVRQLGAGLSAPRAAASTPTGIGVIDGDDRLVLLADDPDVEPIVVLIDGASGLAAGPAGTVWTCSSTDGTLLEIDAGSGQFDVAVEGLRNPTAVVGLPIGAPPELIDAFLVETNRGVILVNAQTGDTERVPQLQSIASLPFDFALPPPERVVVEDPETAFEPPVTASEPAIDDAPSDMPGVGLPSDVPTTAAVDPSAPADGDLAEAGVPWWAWLALLPFLLAMFWALLFGRGRHDTPTGEPGGGAEAPIPTPAEGDEDGALALAGVADPCEQLRRACADSKADCDSARAAAASAADAAKAAADRAATAKAAAATAAGAQRKAEHAKAAADRDVAAANEVPDEGSSIEDDEGRITQQDLGLKRAASKAAYARYQAGEITAVELESEWDALGDRDAIDALRAADAEHRAARAAAAAEAAAAAAAALAQAQATAQAQAQAAAAEAAAAEAATTEATAAQEAADEACREAEARCAELAECEQRETARQQAAAAAAATAAEKAREDAARQAAEDERQRAEQDKAKASGGGKKPCCPDCTWVGYGYMTGGHSIFAGIEYTTIYLHCASDPSIWIKLECQTLRIGPGLGGEGAAVGAISFGCSPTEAMQGIRSALNGWNFDISLGVPATKLVKNAAKGKDISRALKLLRKLGGKKLPPPKLPGADVAALKAAGAALRSATKGGGKAAGTQASQQTSGLQGLVVPLGSGVQIGLWKAVSTKIWVTDSNLPAGCKHPPPYTKG